MSELPDRPNPITDAAIDRLVDGDLGEAERRELLLRLEDEPDGWRRCALAFLEDQAWRLAMAGAVTPAARPFEAVRTPDPAPGGRPSRLRYSLAASILAATFAAGFAVRGAARDPRTTPPGRGDIALQKPDAPPPDGAPGAIREVGWIDLVDRSAGESPPQRVPILSGPGLDDEWLRDQPPSVSEYVRAQWERQGYQVEERRRLVSLDLEDGRRVSIPVDEVELEFVGQNPL